MIFAQLQGPSSFWSQESIDALQEWLILVGLGIAVLLGVLALYSYARKLFDKEKKAGLD